MTRLISCECYKNEMESQVIWKLLTFVIYRCVDLFVSCSIVMVNVGSITNLSFIFSFPTIQLIIFPQFTIVFPSAPTIHCYSHCANRDFVTVCKDALDLNAKLITTEQKEYHESLKSGFMEIAERLSILLGEKVGLGLRLVFK